MKRRFPEGKYRQRWQVESVVSRLKRRLGYALRARRNETRATEYLVRVLTYNLLFTCQKRFLQSNLPIDSIKACVLNMAHLPVL